MGEWSKSIGEKGERVTKFIFEEILGVNSLVENTTIGCHRGEKHKSKKSEGTRTTHGIDGLYFYESPLEDELLEIVLISSKYVIEYPKYPRSKFKNHLADLAQAIECFKMSKMNNEINQSTSTVAKTNYTGLLVWPSNNSDDDFGIVSKVSNIIIDSTLEFEKIILIDNSRINFLYETIYKAKLHFDEVKYVYHNSSLNNKSFNRMAYGDVFPIEYLYSDMIILRVKTEGKIQFLIFVNDNFDTTNLSLILSFAKNFLTIKCN